MGTHVFKLPDIGEGIAEAEIVAWHVKVGDMVKEDQPLVDVMTEKATVEIGAPVSGKILTRNGTEGEMAAVGSELVVIATEDGTGESPPHAAGSARERVAPVAAESPVAVPATPVAAVRSEGARRKPLAAPAVRKRAVSLGIDLATVGGTGPDGQIRHEDLDAVLLARGGTAERPALAEPREGIEEVRVIGLRRQIAEAMIEAKRRIPHFSYVEEVDVTELEELRDALNTRFKDVRPRLTLLPLLIRALTRALPEHPGINAHYDDAAGIIRRHAAIHVGVATQTRRGLLVPVVRHVEARDLWGIAAEIARLTEAARSGKASREELSGSTITISSLGPLGGIAATPIVKPPEVAVVGVNRIVERPVVREGQIAIRKMMNLSSSFDHRVVDGYDAAAFIKSLKDCLETPALLFVD
jgi:2-oxoisovalerate dehydrogenase E2 component (dihydrolipoyl transacylase)